MQAKTMIICAAALLASACGGKDQAGASANADTGLTASAISSNDVTAIDAVTGEAANMAADMDFTNIQANGASTGSKGTNTGKTPAGSSRDSSSAPAENRTQSRAQPEPAAEPANATE